MPTLAAAKLATKPTTTPCATCAEQAALGPQPPSSGAQAAGLPLYLQFARLDVGSPTDPLEREADAFAAQARVAPPATPCPGGCPDQPQPLSRPQAYPPAQPLAPPLSRLPRYQGATLRPPDAGQPVAPALRANFESDLGVDLAEVRVHRSAVAQATAASLHAKAFTHGHDIWLGPRQSPDDANLLAHEVAHVVQQTGPAPAVQRRVDGDIRGMSITRAWAEALTDDEMVQQVRLVRGQLVSAGQGSPEAQSARDNLAVLEQVQNTRNLNRLAATGGIVTQQTTPRPPGLPAGGGFTLVPAPPELSVPAEAINQLPEGQLVDAPPALMAAAVNPALPVFAPVMTGAPPATNSSGLGTAGMATSVTSLATLQSSGAYLQTYGFAAAGENAIGFVAIPRLGTPGQIIPQSTSVWGHTAMYVRQGGRITVVRGFMPGDMLDTLLNARQIEAGARGTPAAIANDTRLFLNTGARSLEYAVDPALAAQAARGLPAVGPVQPGSGLPLQYTARPAVQNVCTQSNCGLWAVEQMEGHLGGPVGPRPGVSVTALGEGGAVVPRTASQGRLINFTQGDAFAPVPGGTNPTVGGMSTGFKVLRWGGRIFFVFGIVMVGAEIYMARPEDRARTAVGATAGFVGGLALGAAAGLVCGPGAPVCSLVLGITFGVIGGLGSRAAAESVYDATHLPSTGVPATTQNLAEFNAAWQRGTGGRCPSGNCHQPAGSAAPGVGVAGASAFPANSAFAQPGLGGAGGLGGVSRQLSDEDRRILSQWLQTSQPAAAGARP